MLACLIIFCAAVDLTQLTFDKACLAFALIDNSQL